MNLSCNQIVLNKRGNYGVVACFNGEPCLVIFAAFTMTLNRFDDNLKAKKDDYSIEKVFQVEDGNEIEMKDVFKKSFKAENLKVVFERKKLIRTNYDFIKKGAEVYWEDPDKGRSSGVYTVISNLEEIEEDSVILIASDYSEAEVYPCELYPI